VGGGGNRSSSNNYKQNFMSKVLMHGAVIHGKRRESASIYFGTQSEAGNAEVVL